MIDGSLVLLLGAGLAAGLVHVCSGADHLAALLPLAVGRGRAPWMPGVRWGLGHSAGVLAVAVAFGLLRDAIDFDGLGLWGEHLVGVSLIAVGVLGLRTAGRRRLHVHEHEHDGARHAHLHVHAVSDTAPDDHAAPDAHLHRHAAFGTGLLHGIAGTAHLVGVLPTLPMDNWTARGTYLAAYATGSILAMGGFTAVVGWASDRWGRRAPALMDRTLVGACVLTILVGTVWLARA